MLDFYKEKVFDYAFLPYKLKKDCELFCVVFLQIGK